MADPLPSSGHIDPKSFPFTLVGFYRQGATGSLKVEGGNHQKALYFRGGRVLFGSSNDPKDQLGAILIESGRITEQQLEDVNQKVGPGNPLAKALSDSGVVSQRELSEAARAKVERILSDVLSYSDGRFEFEDGVLPKGAVDLKLAPERLFMAAVRRVGDRSFVLRHLDGLDVMLSTKTEFQEKLPEIESEVAGLPAHFDGLTTLKEAAGRAAIDEFEAAKIACGLLFLGLIEKSGAVVVGGEEAGALFQQPTQAAELDLGGSAGSEPTLVDIGSSTLSIDASELATPPPSPEPPAPPPGDADATIVMGDVPNLSLPPISPPPAPEPPSVPSASAAAPREPPPLKIIAPPRPAEATRPPSKPNKDDLSALDELLGKRSPEGPLTPIQKPAEEWKPTFLPERPRPGGRKPESGRRKMLVGITAAGVATGLAAAGWLAWSNRAVSSPRTAAVVRPSAPPSAPAASPSATASLKPSTVPSAAATAPPTPAATASPVKASPLATPPPTPAAKATPTPLPKAASAGASLDDARAALRKGRFDDAARGFQSVLKESKSSHSVQILLACSTDTLQKAVDAVQASEFYVLPVHYKGKDCYRVGWGLYESEAKATAGVRGVPQYFRQGGARPKVVSLSEMLQ
jgi:hypothetical protein